MSHARTAACLSLLLLAACKPSAPDANDTSGSPAAPLSGTQAPERSPETEMPPPPKTPMSAQMPSLKVKTLGGDDYDLAAQRGKWVVVNFWATWCGPCLKEMPELSALDAMREHVEVIGLAYEEIEPKELQAFLLKHPVVYPVAIVDVYDPPQDFETPRGLPTTYLVGPDGKLAKQFLGPVTAREVEDAITAAGGPKAG